MSIERISSFEYCWCCNDYRYIYIFFFCVRQLICVWSLLYYLLFFSFFFCYFSCVVTIKIWSRKWRKRASCLAYFRPHCQRLPSDYSDISDYFISLCFVCFFFFSFWFGFVGFLFLFLIKTRCGFVETGSFWRVVTVAEPMKPPIQPLKAITIFLQSMAGCPSIGSNWWCINIGVVVITGGRTEHTSCEWPITAHVTRQSASDQRETLNGDVGRWIYKSGRFFTLMGLLLVAHIKHGTNMASIRSLLVECLAAYC